METTLYGLFVSALIVGAGIFLKKAWTRFLDKNAKLEDEHEENQDKSLETLGKTVEEHAKRIWNLEMKAGKYLNREEVYAAIEKSKNSIMEEINKLEIDFKDNRKAFDKFKEAVNEKFFKLLEKLNPNKGG